MMPSAAGAAFLSDLREYVSWLAVSAGRAPAQCPAAAVAAHLQRPKDSRYDAHCWSWQCMGCHCAPSHLLLDPRPLALLHAFDGIVLDGLLLPALVHLGMLAGAQLLVYAAMRGRASSMKQATAGGGVAVRDGPGDHTHRNSTHW